MWSDFTSEYLDMIGRRPSEADEKIALRNIGVANERTAIRGYIGTLQEFKDRYRAIVTRMYRISKECDPDDVTLEYYINRFIDPEYTAEDIVEDLEDEVHQAAAAVVILPAAAQPINQTQTMIAFASLWKSGSGRKIDVYEFIRYYGQDLSEADVRIISQRESEARMFVDKIHRDYLGRGVNMDEFLERYLFDHDNSNFHNEVITTVLSSDEYRCEMAKQLDKRYACKFGTPLHPEDMEYVLFQVRAKSLPLYSEEIDTDVVRVNDQLRTINEWSDKIYEDVLCRPADCADVRECVSEFRAYGDKEAESRLRKRLYQSLEFHDVVKQHILQLYQSKRERTPSKREMYECLSEVLKKNGKDMSSALGELEINIGGHLTAT